MALETPWPLAGFPALAALGLSREQLAALAKAGSLQAERGGGGRIYCKLRYRSDWRQCVCYVGNNPEFVKQVQRELVRLQAHSRACRQLRILRREANASVRRTIRQLAPLLLPAGYCFHGREIRRLPRQVDVYANLNASNFF